ncbi:MAG TPA: AAC(3) family N-acetyltransferase, partial [Bacillota bacterium]
LTVIGQAGTLVVPTLTGKREDSPNCPPVFDVRKTPCWTGIIPETVRNMDGVTRSLHPTHSVAALGSRKLAMTSGHEDSASPCDAKSPFFKNAVTGGYILLIGVDQESNTSVHSCEEIAEVPYHLQRDVSRIYITGYEEERILVVNRLHDWGKPPTNFNKLDELYKNLGMMTMGKIGSAEVRLIKSAAMFDFTIDLLKKDPLFLLV